jgi:hypothetical protein
MIGVDIREFKSNLRRYSVIAGKAIKEAIKEEARIIAQRLTAITPPKTSGQGKKRIESDIRRVYLDSSWFLETFSFKNKKIDERIKEAVRDKNQNDIEQTFQKSEKLRRIHVESFDADNHKRLRKNGRIGKGIAPYSFPLNEQNKVKAYIKQKQKAVGTAKSGWASCVKALGGTVAGWLNKAGLGRVIISDAFVILINSAKNISELDSRGKFSQTILSGRDRDLAKKTEVALKNVKW